MGKKYYENKPKPKKQPDGSGLVCFYRLVLELVKQYGTARFTIDDGTGQETKVRIDENGFLINGTLLDPKSSRVFITQNREAFESLFVQAMTEHVDIRKIMPRVYLANLLDTSARTKKTAKMTFTTEIGKQVLHIECSDGMPKMKLDGKDIGVQDAEAFISRNYMQFLAGMKSADRSMTHERSQNSKYKEYKARQKANMHGGVQHSRIVDGKLIVDLQSFIPQGEQTGTQEDLRKKDLDLGMKKPGYVDKNNED